MSWIILTIMNLEAVALVIALQLSIGLIQTIKISKENYALFSDVQLAKVYVEE